MSTKTAKHIQHTHTKKKKKNDEKIPTEHVNKDTKKKSKKKKATDKIILERLMQRKQFDSVQEWTEAIW